MGTKILSKKYISKAVIALLLAGIAVLFLFPVVITFTNSFMNKAEIGRIISTGTISLLPDKVTLSQYYDLFVEKPRYIGMFWNSILFGASITLFHTIISVMTAYAFAKLKFRFKNFLFFLYIIMMMMPFQVALLPNYIINRTIGLLDTRWSVILPGIFAPFGVFLLTQFFKYIPDERIECVLLENKSIWQVLRIAIIPSAKPGIIALLVLNFAENWNMVEQPLILIRDEIKRPLSIAFNSIISQGVDIAFAGSFFYMAPIIILYLFFEEQIIRGLEAWSTTGEIKD